MKTQDAAGDNAFSLVEVVLALAITSFCLIVLLGILPVSLTTIKNASEETAGINVISTIVSDLKSTPSTNAASLVYGLALPTAGASVTNFVVDPSGQMLSGVNASGAQYKVTVTMDGPTSQNTITGVARVSWPAQAVTPTATVESFFALNRN